MSLRTRLTERMLKDTLVGLLQTRELRQVTVKQLCHAADVNKSTLYAHYDNVYALFDAAERDFIEQTVHANERFSGAADDAERRANYRGMCEFYRQHRDELVAFVSADARFVDKVTDRFVQVTSAHFGTGPADDLSGRGSLQATRLRLLIECADYDYLHVVYAWLTRYPELTADEVADILMAVTSFAHGDALRSYVENGTGR